MWTGVGCGGKVYLASQLMYSGVGCGEWGVCGGQVYLASQLM